MIVDTRWNRRGEAVLTSTHNVYFESKNQIRKLGIPLQTPAFLHKNGG